MDQLLRNRGQNGGVKHGLPVIPTAAGE